jgi:hypothetical protein
MKSMSQSENYDLIESLIVSEWRTKGSSNDNLRDAFYQNTILDSILIYKKAE